MGKDFYKSIIIGTTQATVSIQANVWSVSERTGYHVVVTIDTTEILNGHVIKDHHYKIHDGKSLSSAVSKAYRFSFDKATNYVWLNASLSRRLVNFFNSLNKNSED